MDCQNSVQFPRVLPAHQSSDKWLHGEVNVIPQHPCYAFPLKKQSNKASLSRQAKTRCFLMTLDSATQMSILIAIRLCFNSRNYVFMIKVKDTGSGFHHGKTLFVKHALDWDCQFLLHTN